MAYTPLNLPQGFVPTAQQTNLIACFSVFDPDQLRNKSYKTETYKQHHFSLHAVTAKGAGGTGKTTTGAVLATGLVTQDERRRVDKGGKNVVAVSTDSQQSLEDRLLGKVVHQASAQSMMMIASCMPHTAVRLHLLNFKAALRKNPMSKVHFECLLNK